MSRMFIVLQVFVLSLALIATGCGDDGDSSSDNNGSTGTLGGLGGGGGGSAPETCSEIIDCVANCNSNDGCGCWENGTGTEAKQASAFINCVNAAGCQDEQCLVEYCHLETFLCIADPQDPRGSDNCDTLMGCMSEAASNGASAAHCIQSASVEAYDEATAIDYCIASECGYEQSCIDAGSCDYAFEECRY